MAGEIGHLVLDPSGPECACGARGCWEAFASSYAAIRLYVARTKSKVSPTIAEIHALADEGDKDAIAALTEQAQNIGRGLRLVTASLSPEVIFIAGDITTVWNLVGPIIEREMKATLLAASPPKLVPSQEGGLARLRGAAALVLQRHSGKKRTRDVPHQSQGAKPKQKLAK
jgi:predicted NBD/HSP70 family sugar kinase